MLKTAGGSQGLRERPGADCLLGAPQEPGLPTWILDFGPPELQENEFVFLSHPRCAILLEQLREGALNMNTGSVSFGIIPEDDRDQPSQHLLWAQLAE